MMFIHANPPAVSAVERVLVHGPAVLSDAELLSVFLSPGRHGGALELAEAVFAAAGGLAGLTEENRNAILAVRGMTERMAARVFASTEVSRRLLFASVCERDVMSSPEDVRRYFALNLAHLSHEVFSALFLDNRHRVIEYRELFHGTIDGAAVYPREVVKRCLANNSVAVIFAHNHPSGVPEPSDTDVRLTRKLVDALALIDVRVLDHIIVGRGVMTSLAERRLM